MKFPLYKIYECINQFKVIEEQELFKCQEHLYYEYFLFTFTNCVACRIKTFQMLTLPTMFGMQRGRTGGHSFYILC